LKLARERGFSVVLFDEHQQPALTPAIGCYRRVVVRWR
jgi:hypothetical protein